MQISSESWCSDNRQPEEVVWYYRQGRADGEWISPQDRALTSAQKEVYHFESEIVNISNRLKAEGKQGLEILPGVRTILETARLRPIHV